MATYEELLDYANKYNPQQQQLGVNSFNQGGMIQQEETPYQKMMRETYGAPAQQQEEQGILGSVVNRFGGQPQQQEEPSYLNSFLRGAAQQGGGTIGGQADFIAGVTGSETVRDIGDAIQKTMQNYSRPKEYTLEDITKNGLSSIKDYLLDPNGFAFDVGGGFGSSGVMMAEAALLSAALPSSIAAAGTGAIATLASKIGLKSIATALKNGSTAGKLIKNVIASSPLEAGSESGGVYREMTTDEHGNRISMDDADMDKVQEAMAKNFVANLGILGASNLLESVGIGKLFNEKMRQGILGKIRAMGAFAATNVGQNAWEEGAQEGASQYAQGKIDSISQIVNPYEWNPEQANAAFIGGVAGFGQGAGIGGAGYVMNKIAGPQQQEGNPAVNIQNKVTNEEFGDAVAIAKHDTSTNLVDRMRNLEGRIGHHASDGTNCARTIGLALAGTDYQDLINVDDFVKIAQNKGQLKDPNSYVPKPGDLAVVNDGNHIVMVSENGGTIQNGSSRDGVYESAQSPLQMFGSVKYYISTSDMSSGDYGVAGNLQGVNEEQRQQEYYKNLVAQESQRRADAIREVLGAKTHEQEQQEQAVSEAQKYQQDNASELGPISNYYNAFTEQELAALTPEQKQTLKNNFDGFYSDKQNWGHTAIEKVQTARQMYSQLIGNRQQMATVQQQAQPQVQAQQPQVAPVVQRQATPTTAPATNVQQQVAQPKPTQTANVAQAQTPQVQQQAAPTTTPTTETAVSPTEKQKPVVQQQNYKTRSEAAKDLPSRIQKAVTDANGDYAKLHSALTTEATDLENDLSFGKITQDEYKTAKAQLDEAQNKYLYNKNNQTTQTEISPDEWEKRLRKATEDLGEAYRNGNITKDEYERRMQEIDDAYDTNVTQKRGVTQYSPDETGFMERQAAEQKAIDENVAKGNRVKFQGMLNDLYKKRKNGQTEEDKQLIASQVNAASKTGLAMLDKGATAEEAFNAVKDSIGTEKQKAKAKADAEKQAKKGEKKNAVTEQKPTELQKSETEQGGDQNVNAKPEEGKRQENKNSQTAEDQGKVEVKEKPAVSNAEEALRERVNKEFATEEERALAMSILTDKETPLKALEKRKKENKKRHDQDINDFTEAEYNALQKEGHQGVTLVPLESDPDSGRKKRASNNPKWYQELYASYGGTPSMAAVRRLAIDVLTGENTDVWADRGVPKAAIEQMEPEFEQKRAELDAIDKRFNDEEALLDSITPGIEKINAEMKKEISKYRREAKKAATQQAENVVQSNEEGVNGQNVDDESGLRKLSDGNTAGSVQQNEDGRETGNLSGDENGPGEATLQTDDGLVQNEESGTTGDDGRGSGELSGRAAEIRNATDEQNALRTGNDVEAAQKAYDEELDRITKDFEDGKITEEEAEKRFAEAEDKLNKALESTQGDEGASSMPENTDYQAAATQNEQVKRSLDELITEAKKAFKGAKGFRINRNDLIFTMPNGLEMKVNIEDQILLNAADEAKARKEHGLDEGGITVEGYAKRLDKGSLVALSKDSRIGTAFHEAFHTVWDWALNEKEKAAMLKHFKALAEEQGVSVDEVMADAYRDWLLARQQHKGTVFGKLFQKIKDFINSALMVLTGAENVHNVYRQIESGKVWNRDAKGRFAKAENSEKRFKINVDVDETRTYDPNTDFVDLGKLKDEIGITDDDEATQQIVIDYIKKKLTNTNTAVATNDKRLNYSFDHVDKFNRVHVAKAKGNKGRRNTERRHATNVTLSNFSDVLSNSILVEIDNRPLKKNGFYANKKHQQHVAGVVRAVVPVKLPNGDLRTLVITADNRSGQLNKEKIAVSPYEISTRKIKAGAARMSSMYASTYSLADILSGVKGLDGEPYVDPTTGKLNIETDPTKRFSITSKSTLQQQYTSADTSLNQVPAVFKKVSWKSGTTNIDIGGGRYDTATDFMKDKGVTNVVFDPFNRDAEHNRNAFEKIQSKGDTVTVANVLNVIKEADVRDNVILQAAKALKPDGTAYFGIYEGDASGNGKETSKGWQNNRKTADYVPEIAKHFKTVKKSGNVITASNPIVNRGETATWNMDANGNETIRYSIRPSDTPLQRTHKLQAQADRYNAIELNAVTAKDPTARKYMKDQIVKRQLQGLTKKAEKAEAKKRAEKYADDLLEKLDEVVAMVEKVAKRFPAMQDWQNRPIVTITKEERERLKKEKAFRNDVMYRVIDENGKVEPVVNAFKNNAEYPINMDFGTLCMKKEAIDAVVQILVDKGKGQNLGPTQNEMLKDLLREFGYAVPCDVCFVETKRERMLPDANKTAYAWESVLMAAKINDGKAIGERTSFTEEQEKRLKEMAGQVKGKTFKQAYEEYMPHDRRRTKTNGEKGTDLDTGVTSTAMRKLAKLFLEDPALAGKLEPTTIITSKGTDDLIRIYGGHTNIKNVLSGLYGSANAKPIEGFSVYDALSWILMDNDAITKDWDKLIDMGGGRVQSFSDYNPLLFLEYIQMVVDYQARNMPMHAYTKVPMFAKLFGKTGIMINMSFVPEIIKDEHDTLDEKGKLVHAGLKYNPKTGKFDLYAWHKDSFPIEEALEIRKDKGYAKHVGTIAVGVSDEHIKKMMADPEIDMIIPYHKSGMPAAVQNKTGLKYAKDYTDFQNPGITDEAKEEIVKRLANGDAKAFEKKYGEGAESYLKNRYLNYSRLLVKEGTPEKAAQEYLNRCKDLGCTPVFEMFAYKDGNKEAGIVAPGYYKMLEDFRGYDSEMNPIMQGPVRLYSTDENGEKHLNLPDNVEELLTDSLADRTAQLESLEQLKNNKEFWRKADKLMETQRADGEVRKAMVDRLSSALGSQNVKTLENGAFLDELEKLYRENGMSEESAKEKVEMFRRFDGAVYGFAKGGAIYLNENYFNANTPAHEFTHIWAKVAQKKNNALWKKGVALLEKTEEWNKVVKDPLYENIIGNKDAIASEVLARIVGERNADFIRDELLDPAKKQGRGEGLWAQIREWMKDIFKSIRSIFDPIKGRRLTYDEFTKMPLKALWDTSEHEQFRESLNELAQQQERADEVHADAIELQVKPGKETAVTIKDGVFTKGPHKGEAVKFADAILDDKKHGETRPKKTLPRNKWVGINRDGMIIGRVKFGDPIEITKGSDEYNDAMIENTDYDIEEGQTKWYYPVIDKQDFRKNPIKSEFYSQSLKQYDLPLAQQKEAVREQYKGTDKWMKAPNGKPTNLTEDQWVTTQTPQFKEWFGDSKVVDENGEPLVVYHGTNADFDVFNTRRDDTYTRWGRGAYFTTGKGTAETYAKERTAGNGGKPIVGAYFLNAQNIFDNEMTRIPKEKSGAWNKLMDFLKERKLDLQWIVENARQGVAAGIAYRAFDGGQWEANAKFREKLEEFGFDGISARLEDGTEYVVFNANQIKDASGNNVSITKDSDNVHYSITSTLGKAIKKADAYANRNVRKPNENTATGRAAKAFNNTQNKNNAQTFTEWLKDRFTKFYREWIDKNDAIHEVDAAIEKITGKKLAEEDKLYNMVQGARAYANGAAQTLVEGTPEAFRALRDSLERGIDPKDKVAMDRVNELKKDFKYATMQQVLEPIMTKDMDEKYPSYLEKHGLNNWHDAFSNYLGARRILELVRLVENKSLEFITHDKKEFTDFIDRHPEYEYFRPKAFAKGSWRTQVQKLAQANPKLAEQMAKDLAKQYKFPNGVTRADLEALVAEAPKEFNTSAQVYYQLQRNTLTLMELGHLIPQAVHDQINKMYKEYCPLMIDYSDTAGLEQAIAQFGRGADSIANVGSMLKQVLQLGSERGLISPLESSYKAIQALTERAERNKVAVHFVKTVANSKELQKSGILQKVDKQHSPDAKNCIFTVLIDGKKVAFKTTQDLYGPIVGYDMPAAGIVEGFCRSAAQTLRYGATTSPSFIIRNFIRDTIFAGVSSRNGFVPVLDSARGLWAYLYNQELRGEFDAMGITAYNYFGSGKNAVKSMDKLMGEKDWNYLKSHPTELIKELIKYIPKKFEAASEAIEASTRMGEYMKARKAGKSMQEAALDARDVTLDFSRSGFYGQRVNMMVPFFNACLQGGDKFFKRMVFSKDPAVRMQTARMVGLYIMLPSAILWFFNHDEPWYEELDPHIKMNNWIIGGVRIPKPQEAGISFGSGIEAMLDKIYNKDPKAGKEWVTAMREVLFPNLIPTVGLPLLEWATNYSLFREKAIEGNRLKRLPTEMRYNSSTTEVSKMVGKATGLSPVKLDNTIRGYTGTLGMLLAQAPDIFFESKQNLPSRPITERAMVRDFFLNDMNMNRTSEEFYELVNTAQQQHAGYGKKGKPTPTVAAVNKALRDVSKQQKEIHMITDAKNISPDRKRQMIDRKREIIRTIQKKTLQRYRDKFNV